MSVKSKQVSRADSVVVLDFETSGLSPDMGDRAIEIGAVMIENGRITDRFQKLMNPGIRIDAFIQGYTGISNAMVKGAASCASVMKEFGEFIGHHNLVAHNASFDKKFLDAEMGRAKARYGGTFACSMLIARRLYQNAPNHKLGTLVEYKKLPTKGVFHRALADAEMTAHLWLKMLDDLDSQYDISDVPFALMTKLARTAKRSAEGMLKKQGMVAVAG